ncbi:hypothetical protein A0H81_02859 [Grifola frondosa]|uniref:Uncharacterized protein n=1 Tax=Grifola frondosa TaxID=5627 RepID=A0A1C7MM59_GRIFR|nr:hypothetical protein A0H81_02859 [Grifola frondosa]
MCVHLEEVKDDDAVSSGSHNIPDTQMDQILDALKLISDIPGKDSSNLPVPLCDLWDADVGNSEAGELGIHNGIDLFGHDDDTEGLNMEDELDVDHHEDIEPSSAIYPWLSMAIFLTDLLFSSPRLHFSEVQKAAILSWGKDMRATNVPTIGAVKRCQDRILKLMGDPTEKVVIHSGTTFYINDIEKAIAKDYVNLITQSAMCNYPVDSEGGMSQKYNIALGHSVSRSINGFIVGKEQSGMLCTPQETIAEVCWQVQQSVLPGGTNKIKNAVAMTGTSDTASAAIVNCLLTLGKQLQNGNSKQPEKLNADANSPQLLQKNSKSKICAQLEKKLETLLGGQAIEDRINPLLRMPGVNIHMDTPTEILYTILLEVIKYFWGLNNPTLGAEYICKYKGSLIGKHFKSLVQVMPFLVYDLVLQMVLDGWTAIDSLIILLWHTEITNMEDYLAELSCIIEDFLNITAFPAVLFSTERYESFNHIFRLASIYSSNCQAPSHDTCNAFTAQDIIKHVATREFWFDTKQKKWACTGDVILHFMELHPVQASLLGHKVQPIKKPGSGSGKGQTAFHAAVSFLTRNGDNAQLSDHVLYRERDAERPFIGKVVEILIPVGIQTAHHVLLKKSGFLGQLHLQLHLPCLELTEQMILPGLRMFFAWSERRQCSGLPLFLMFVWIRAAQQISDRKPGGEAGGDVPSVLGINSIPGTENSPAFSMTTQAGPAASDSPTNDIATPQAPSTALTSFTMPAFERPKKKQKSGSTKPSRSSNAVPRQRQGQVLMLATTSMPSFPCTDNPSAQLLQPASSSTFTFQIHGYTHHTEPSSLVPNLTKFDAYGVPVEHYDITCDPLIMAGILGQFKLLSRAQASRVEAAGRAPESGHFSVATA